jgi:hypothetical protein
MTQLVRGIPYRARGAGHDIRSVLATGPFHVALRAAIRARGLTLERLRSHLGRRGIEIGLSTLSEWQQGRSRPGQENSVRAVSALEDILGVPRTSLVRLLTAHPAPAGTNGREDGRDGRRWRADEGAFNELLDSIPGSRGYPVDIVAVHVRIFIDARRRCTSVATRTVVRAAGDGVDRYLRGYTGGPGAYLDDVIVRAMDNCRLGSVHRHPTAPAIMAELLFGQVLKAGETWVFEDHIIDGTGRTDTEFARFFRHPAEQFLLDVRFDPRAIPADCWSYVQTGPDDQPRRTQTLTLNSNQAVHLVAFDVQGGVVGIGWAWT